MRKKLFCLLLLSGLCSMGAMAEEQDALVIRLADQTTVQFLLPDQQPSLMCFNGSMSVWFTEKGTWETLEFTPDEVAEMKIEIIEVSAVEEVRTDEQRIRFDLSRGSVVRVSGLQEGDQLQVVSLDGKSVKAPVSRYDGEAIIDLGSQPRGGYVVSVNRSFTFKLLKP